MATGARTRTLCETLPGGNPAAAMLFAGLLVLFAVLALVWGGEAKAAPAAPVPSELKQPDGETFTARRFGDEWSNGWETPQGYTIVRDPESRAWEYAVEGPGSGLRPSGRTVGD